MNVGRKGRMQGDISKASNVRGERRRNRRRKKTARRNRGRIGFGGLRSGEMKLRRNRDIIRSFTQNVNEGCWSWDGGKERV